MDKYKDQLETTAIKIGTDIMASLSHVVSAAIGIITLCYQLVSLPFKLAYDKLNDRI